MGFIAGFIFRALFGMCMLVECLLIRLYSIIRRLSRKILGKLVIDLCSRLLCFNVYGTNWELFSDDSGRDICCPKWIYSTSIDVSQ